MFSFGANGGRGLVIQWPVVMGTGEHVLWAELDMGRVHPRVGSGRVGLGRVGSRFFPYLVGWVGSGPFVWVCVGHPGLYKMLR